MRNILQPFIIGRENFKSRGMREQQRQTRAMCWRKVHFIIIPTQCQEAAPTLRQVITDNTCLLYRVMICGLIWLILSIKGAYGSAWKNDAGVRDAWSALLRIVGKRKMRQWLKEGMQKAGVTGVSRNKPIEVTYN